uniref:Orc1-like AAA ATPase domain-containing protein n=1 Tax=mine drainage metagenome TaxID=410659 RepID=E6PTM5_9ZZZZ
MSERHLKSLLKYCPTGSSEGEKSIRNEIFVNFQGWASLIMPPANCPILLVGKKGAGKSILVDFSIGLLEAKGMPCAKLRPRDLNLDDIPIGASVSQAHSQAYAVLIQAAAAAFGEKLSGILSEAEAALLNEAINNGSRKPDIISKASKILPKLAKGWTKVDLSVFLPEVAPASVKKLDNSLKEALISTGSQKAIYIFIDDTDQVASPAQPGQLNRIWGLLLAARELAELSEEIKCVVTIREEVWLRLSSDQAGQRDQTDHFFSLIRRLDPKTVELREIVRRRLDLAKTDSGEPIFKERYSVFFQGNRPHMPSSDEVTSWEDLIVTRSRGRPRDCVQLINALASTALKAEAPTIGDDMVLPVVQNFSDSRVTLLSQENENELPNLREIIKSFAAKTIYDQGSFKSSNIRIIEYLKSVPSMFSVILFGVALAPNNAQDAIKLLAFLYRTGFLNARYQRPGGSYLHIEPGDEPKLVSWENMNNLQRITWEVHPAYRDYLISAQGGVLYRRPG